MTTYESDIKTISANNEMVFTKLTDLRNLESFIGKIPADAKITDVKCEEDCIHLNINPVGKIGLCIIEREAFKTIKFTADNSPIEFNLWIQLVPDSDTTTKLKITLKAEIPAMIKVMLGNKLQNVVDKMAEGLSKIDY